jgi:outer membrane lipopolysaccharide assembly protein LptE/RlpB
MQTLKTLLLLLALSLGACGFHLRGSGESSPVAVPCHLCGGEQPGGRALAALCPPQPRHHAAEIAGRC